MTDREDGSSPDPAGPKRFASIARRIAAISMIAAFLVVLGLSAGAVYHSGHPAEAFPSAENVGVITQACLPNGTDQVTVAWSSYNQGSQWIDLSLSDNGFPSGSFISEGPMQPDMSTFVWNGLLPGLSHYLRINTATQFGWMPSQTATVITRSDCALGYGPGATNFSVAPSVGATNLSQPTQTCASDGAVNINVSWLPSNQGNQWVDLSMYNNGFAPGTSLGYGPMSPNQGNVSWNGLLPNLAQYVRINTLVGTTWVPSQPIQFFSRGDCAAAQTPIATAVPSTAAPATTVPPTAAPSPAATSTPSN